jgi:Zn-dependent metalloprotease
MRSQKRVSGLVLAAIALQLSVVPVQLNAFRAPDEQKGVQNMKKSDSLQSLHLKRVLQNNLQKKVGGNTILAVEDLVQNIFNSGISNALTKVSGNSNANVTSSSMSHKLQSGTTLSIASIRQTQTDNLGFKHIRVSQEYKDLPVVGAEIIVHINNNDNIYDKR